MAAPNIPTIFQDQSIKERKNKRKFVYRTCSPSDDDDDDDDDDFTRSWLQNRKPKRCKLNDQKNLNGKSKSFVAIQAEELQSKLDPRYPSFVKFLLKSHVTGGFWMGLPASFCQKHLPSKDTIITLETRSKKKYKTKYLVRKTGLSGGWKGFAISEKLLVGDVLVFQLIADAKFKVYAVKENNATEVDRAPFLLKCDTPEKQSDLGARKCVDLPEVEQRNMQPPPNSENTPESSYGHRSRAIIGFPMSEEAAFSSNAIPLFEDFSIVIDKLVKECKLSTQIKWDYYRLCCSQRCLLHASLLQSMNHIMIGGVIIQIVTIADVLKKCDLSTSKEEFAIWDKKLHSLELLEVKIGFLRAHLHNLLNIVHDPEVATFKQQYVELCSENSRADEEIKSVAARLSELKKLHKKRAVDIDNLAMKINNHKLLFQEQAQSSW